MVESRPSLEIRLKNDEVQIHCSDYDYMEDVLDEYNSFTEFLGSNEGDYYSFIEDSQLEDFGSFLRSNEYPYLLYRADGELIDTWKPTCDANGEGLCRVPAIDAELATVLRSNGYLTLEDIRVVGYEHIQNHLNLHGADAYDIWRGAEEALED